MNPWELRELTSVGLGLWADAIGDLADAELHFEEATVLEAVARCHRSAATTPLEQIEARKALIMAEASVGIAILEKLTARDQLRFLASLS